MDNRKIAIIGCGNLGLSILNGLIKKPTILPTDIIVTRRNTSTLKQFRKSGVIVTDDNAMAVRKSRIIIIALKPYNILEVITELNAEFDSDKHIIVSLATGIPLVQIQQIISNSIPVFRAMPNTGADVGMSMTCISTNTSNPNAVDTIKQCFNSIGETVFIDEELMDSATVLGACGIAYVLRFIRGMIQGGIQIGFDANTASQIVTHTVKGAAELLIKGNEHPELEIDKVTTPKGCTIAGLNEMEHNGFSSALIKGIVTSFEKIES